MMHDCPKCNATQEFEHSHDECRGYGHIWEVYACMVCGHEIEFAVA